MARGRWRPEGRLAPMARLACARGRGAAEAPVRPATSSAAVARLLAHWIWRVGMETKMSSNAVPVSCYLIVAKTSFLV